MVFMATALLLKSYIICATFCTSFSFLSILYNRRTSSSSWLTSEKTEWPSDAVNHKFIDGDSKWNYWYRHNGMQTSTDDVMVAFVAVYREIGSYQNDQTENINRDIDYYVDLGCGIGSVLLLTAQMIKPKKQSLGIEVQQESASMASRSISELPSNSPPIAVENTDLRCFLIPAVANQSQGSSYYQTLRGKCELVTANPPYLPMNSGTNCLDNQRKFARFEHHGGIEDYCIVAASLLKPGEGRFVFSFWARYHSRVMTALDLHGLRVNRIVRVLGGKPSNTEPFLHIFDVSTVIEVESQSKPTDHDTSESSNILLDIRRNSLSGGLSDRYYSIQSALQIAKRPLKPSARKVKTSNEY